MTSCPYATFQQPEPHPDPFALYARLREEHGPVIPVELEPGVRGWILTDYELIISWSRDTATFKHDSRNWKDFTEGRVDPASRLTAMMAPRPSALFTDGAEHQRYRGAIVDSLSGIREEDLCTITRRYADGLIDRFCERGEADLLADYARILPILVLNGLFGFDEDQGLRFASSMRNVWAGVDVKRSLAETQRALSEVVAARHREPADDVTSRLIAHPSALTDEEVVMQVRIIVTASVQTTADLIASACRLALSSPESFVGRTFSDAALGELVDRVLWESPPITNYPALYPRRDVPLGGGRTIEAGTPVLLGFAAANHFYRRENAERLDGVPNRAHLAWGVGPHRCPARGEAIAMASVALRTLLDRLPELRLAVPPEQLRWVIKNMACTPVSLPVRFTPQAPLAPLAGQEAEAAPPESGRAGDGRGSVLLKRLSPGILARFLGRLLRSQ
ncbi:cytochrome P450 [Nocardiopsis sp. LOL_012]|uniref:cytochrome P450 n=1 Tax=Nocardiopsis sp. LOL_012 TaxID=3345409 RepID=UPI003A88C2CD